MMSKIADEELFGKIIAENVKLKTQLNVLVDILVEKDILTREELQVRFEKSFMDEGKRYIIEHLGINEEEVENIIKSPKI